MNRPKILIADDDREMCAELSFILKEENYDVYAVYDGVEAVREMEKNCYDLLLLDLKMPGLTGYRVLENVKLANPLAKVIILSGKPLGDSPTIREAEARLTGDERLRNEDVLKKADALFGKPYEVEDLLKKIAEFVRAK